MRQLFAIICIILFWNCANNYNQNAAIEEHNKEKFDSFLTQFAQFDGNQPNESFFRQRKEFPNEIFNPVLDKYHFSFFHKSSAEGLYQIISYFAKKSPKSRPKNNKNRYSPCG